jgi:hypothetical protein
MRQFKPGYLVEYLVGAASSNTLRWSPFESDLLTFSFPEEQPDFVLEVVKT